jgi:hypothetical protein
MNRNERRAFGVQLRSTAKKMAASGLEDLAARGMPVAMSFTNDVGGFEQHLSVLVCVDPEMSGVLAEFMEELLSPAEEDIEDEDSIGDEPDGEE